MQVTMKPGESMTIQFDGTDGEFEVHFDTKQRPNAIAVLETAGFKGNRVGNASDTLYHEQFAPTDELIHEGIKRADKLGFFMDASNVVHCTKLVRCAVVQGDFNDGLVVETLNAENEVTGEFDYYATMEELEGALGHRYPQLTI